MINKVLVSIIIILIPFCLYLLINKPIYNQNIDETKEEIIVNLNDNNTINTYSLNDYLIGVVGAEMPASFNYEALKAQAVASRTFALYNKVDNSINTTKSEQAFNTIAELKIKWNDKFDEYYNKIKSSVIDTDNIVIKYNGKLIKSYYYAMSNGYTEDALQVFNETYPYLNVVSSDFDSQANNYLSQKIISTSDFCNMLSIICNNIEFNNEIRDASNRVSSLSINNKSFTGVELRTLLNLRSTDFTMNIENNEVKIETKGYGHGVGMSQYGANYLA